MKTIPLTRGASTIVDDEDYEWASQFSWYARKSRGGSYYARRNISIPGGGGLQKVTGREMQRDLLDPEMKLPNLWADHINGDTLDNRRGNLRLATSSGSNANRRGWSTSGFKGVHYDMGGCSGRRGGGLTPYRVRVKLDGRLYYGRQQPDAISAAREYNRLAIRLHGEFARLNVIPGDIA